MNSAACQDACNSACLASVVGQGALVREREEVRNVSTGDVEATVLIGCKLNHGRKHTLGARADWERQEMPRSRSPEGRLDATLGL